MICTLNPHSNAIKETLSTLKFAQRAKMIKTRAVVNEESSDAEYWKRKYKELLKVHNQSSETAMEVDQINTLPPNQLPTESWNKVLAQQVTE